MDKTTAPKPIEVSAAFTGGLQGSLSATVSLGDPPPPKPPWHQRIMGAANWARLFEWAWDKAQAISDWITGTGLFRQRREWRRS